EVGMLIITFPDELAPGDVLVRTTLSTICGTDIHTIEAPDGIGVPLGHEAVGIVEAVGPGVHKLARGDRIVASCLYVCGECDRCLEGEGAICETFRQGPPGPLLMGLQGERYILHAADTTAAKVPDNIADEQAIFTADVLSIGMATLERAGIRTGDSVAVFGQGPVGLSVVASARALGAGLVMGVDSVEYRQLISRQLGADAVFAAGEGVARVKDATGGRGADIVVDAVGGNVAVFQDACRASRDGGVVSTVLGIQAPPPDVPLIQRTLVATLCPFGTRRLERLMAMLGSGRIDLSPLITHRIPLADAPAGYAMFRERREGVVKILLTP
ncbi:alcohol dehydrogenase catalytic domain-containing protein, partial [bacterium]|nr:alcohol dehydrogenase catalytic domain-containing protein [bacterium]